MGCVYVCMCVYIYILYFINLSCAPNQHIRMISKGSCDTVLITVFYFISIHTTAVYIMVFIMVLFMIAMLKWPCIFICFQCFFWMSEADISKNILIQSNIDFMFLIINYKFSYFDWLDMDLWILFIHLYFIVFTLLIDWLIDWLISYTCILGRN